MPNVLLPKRPWWALQLENPRAKTAQHPEKQVRLLPHLHHSPACCQHWVCDKDEVIL
jgi:hypothetical protein